MLFQTFDYLIFFIIICVASYVLKGKLKQVFLLGASLFFYAYGSVFHTPILIFVILWTYISGLLIGKYKNRILLAFLLIIAFLPLMVYKYLPFFISEIFDVVPNNLSYFKNLMLPIGISFFTFQAVGYVIDVYRGDIEAEKDIVIYGLFVSFFPQLVAGPIERSTQLISQLKENKPFKYENVVYGLRLMGIGLFLKIFVADILSVIVNSCYGAVNGTSSIMLLVSTLFFGIQIYCDFNGYSTIARGSAKVLGIDLMHNFSRPYFSASITQFWRRWHRSLSFWFRDYVFIPLGGSKCSKFRSNINLLITFSLSGIWHGANWTYALWGTLNGVFLIIEKHLGLSKRTKKGFSKFIGITYTYCFINLTWVFFRARSVSEAITIIKKIFGGLIPEILGLINHSLSIGNIIEISSNYLWGLGLCIIGILIVLFIDLYENKYGEISQNLSNSNVIIRWTIYIIMFIIALGFGRWGSSSQFIYFRF